MITKVLQSNNLAATLDYVYQSSKDPQVVESTCFDSSRDGAYEDIKRMIDQRPDVSKPVFHAVLSVPEHEQLSPHAWEDIAREYTHRMGYGEVPFVAVKHQDTSHQHIHIIASRITTDAKIIRDSFEAYRSQEVARTLEKKHELTRVPSSWEVDQRRTRPEDLHRSLRLNEPSQRERMKVAIASSIKKTRDVTAFVDELERQGVRVVPNVTKDGSKVQGISFEREGVKISGSKLDRQYSWNRLKHTLDFEHGRDASVLQRTPQTPARPTIEPRPDVIRARTPDHKHHDPVVDHARSHVPSQRVTHTPPEHVQKAHEPKLAASPQPVWSDTERIALALKRAPRDRGWKAWSDSLKRDGVEPVAKVTQQDRDHIRGVYFVAGETMMPGSKVAREYSHGELEKRLGAPPKGTFERVMVPAHGLMPYASAPTSSPAPIRSPEQTHVREDVLPPRPASPSVEPERAPVRDTMTPLLTRMKEAGYTLQRAPKELEGTWKGVVQDAQGRQFALIEPRTDMGRDEEKARVYLVHLDEKVKAFDAHYERGQLRGDGAIERVQDLRAGDAVVWKEQAQRHTVVRVPAHKPLLTQGVQERIATPHQTRHASPSEAPRVATPKDEPKPSQELPSLQQWHRHMQEKRKRDTRSLQPRDQVKGRLVKDDLELKEGRFAVIETSSKKLVLVPHVEAMKGARDHSVYVSMSQEGKVYMKDLTRQQDLDRSR